MSGGKIDLFVLLGQESGLLLGNLAHALGLGEPGAGKAGSKKSKENKTVSQLQYRAMQIWKLKSDDIFHTFVTIMILLAIRFPWVKAAFSRPVYISLPCQEWHQVHVYNTHVSSHNQLSCPWVGGQPLVRWQVDTVVHAKAFFNKTALKTHLLGL